jgi:hypothetical protein
MFLPHRKHITSTLQVQPVNAIYRFVTMVTVLYIIHRTVFHLKHDVSETEFCVRRQVDPRLGDKLALYRGPK